MMNHTRPLRGVAVLLALGCAGLGCAATAGAASPASGANGQPVLDGAFGTPQLYSGLEEFCTKAGKKAGDPCNKGATLSSWTVGGDSVDLNPHNYWQMPADAASTAQSVDLNGAAPGSVKQNIRTYPPGLTYTLTFSYAGNPNCPLDGIPSPAVKTFNVLIGGKVVASESFDTTNTSDSDMGWATGTVSFTSTAKTTAIQFASTTPSQCGPVITDVAAKG